MDCVCCLSLMFITLHHALAINFTRDQENNVTQASTTTVSPFYDLFDFQTPSNDFFTESLTWEYVENRMISNDTIEFLTTFRSGFERDVVYHQLRNCPLLRLCEFQLAANQFPTSVSCCEPCSCDFPKCLRLGTCCLDILLRKTNTAKESDAATSDVLIQKPECLPLHLSDNKIATSTELLNGALMYNSCPTGTSRQLLHNCTRQYTNDLRHYQDIVPFMNKINGDVYRNIYCAYCNNLFDKTLEKAGISLKCNDQLFKGSEHNTIKAVFEGTLCDLSFIQNANFHLSYCTVSISECNKTGQWQSSNADIAKACKIYTSPIRIKLVSFENIFCAMCNGVEVDGFSCSVPGNGMFTFSGLLKLETSKGSLMHSHTGNNCSDEQLYDNIYKTCRDIVCPPLTVLNNGRCLDMYSDLKVVLYAVYLKIVPANVMSMGKAYTIANDLLNYISDLPMFRNKICGIQLMYHIKKDSENSTTNNIVNEYSELGYYKARIHIYWTDFHQLGDVYEKYIILHKTNHKLTDFDYQTKLLNVLNFEIELFDFNSEPFDIIGNLSSQFTSVFNEIPSPLPFQSLIDNFTYYSTNETGLEVFHLRTNDYFGKCEYVEDLEINIIHLKRCPKISIKQDKRIWRQTDYGIKILDGNLYVNDSDLLYDINGDVMICIDVYIKYMSQFVLSMDDVLSPLSIVSIVSSSLSIVSLALTFVVFLLLPQLRKALPGKTNMSLVLVLICAQCLYLVSSMGGLETGSRVCAALGIVLHFFWLLSLNWMNICTYHMFHVLTRTKLISKESGLCRFFVYHVYAVLMSTIPIIVNISISMATSDSFGYGANACYISSQKMVVYTFGIPAVIVILGNVCMYFLVVHKISKSHSVHKNVQHERNDLLIFIKLSTVTGATWIFGFIYSWTGITVLSYLFIIFNAGQGIFIMFALVINRRVFNMFKRDLLGLSVTSTDVHKRTKSTDDHKASQDSCKGEIL